MIDRYGEDGTLAGELRKKRERTELGKMLIEALEEQGLQVSVAPTPYYREIDDFDIDAISSVLAHDIWHYELPNDTAFTCANTLVTTVLQAIKLAGYQVVSKEADEYET